MVGGSEIDIAYMPYLARYSKYASAFARAHELIQPSFIFIIH